MKKLSKSQVAERDALASKIEDLKESLDAAITGYNDIVSNAHSEVEAASVAYNEAVDEIIAWRDGLVESMDEYLGERSDKWHESDAASEFENWKGEYENLDAEPYEDAEPEPLGEVEIDIAENLRALPESAE